MVEDKITGLMIYYYFVCKKKFWFSVNGISMEAEHENVQIGKILDEMSYSYERKHISINNEINLDFVKKSGIIHEIKKSRKIEDASIWQVKYYLYYLKKRGIEGITAKIDYPLLKKNIEIVLCEKDEAELDDVIINVKKLLREKIPPNIDRSKKCLSCAYYDLCFI